MHWWQNAFSSSPSSSSSRRQAEDGYLHKLGRSLRSPHRRLSRHRKLQDLNDGSSDVWRSPSDLDRVSSVQSPSSSSSAVPQPLPLPELSLLIRRDAAAPVSSSRSNCGAGNVPLPSPKEAANRASEERDKAADAWIGVASNSGIGRISNQDVQHHTDYAETRIFENGHREMNGFERIHDNYKFNVPSSAPTSPLSSPARSPQRLSGDMFTSHYINPQVFQVWSAPEMPPVDMTLGVGFPHRISPEKTAFSVDSSPLHSPRVSPRQSTKIPSGPPSPLHNRLSHEMAIGRRESSAQGNVHPLPLPPGAATSPPRVPSLQPIAKPEMVPMKSQWQKGKLLGRGTFGSVYVATNRETGALCAMKEVEIITDDPRSAECIKQLQQEIKILSQLKHPNIVQYYGSEIVGDKFHIYLEYVHPGSINKYVHEHCGAMTESVVRNFTRHILSGLAYLHSTRTIHRDIKGANLLVDAYGVVKLADFGMSKHLNGQMSHLSLKGSPHWMAPELLQSVMQKDTTSDAALAVDIWSLGCTIIEMLNGKPPWSDYEGAAAMFKVLRETPPIPETLSPEGKDFLRCCFRRNPAERPSANILLEHRFLRNSLQLDVPSFNQGLNGMKLANKQCTPRERPHYKIDRLPLSPEAQVTKGKLVNNATCQRSEYETADLAAVYRCSPRSTLEAVPGLSPPRSVLDAHHLSPSPNAPALRNRVLERII